jgi:hypothetical protein
LAFAVVVAAIYLVVLRLVDLNEREPFWALGLALVVGALAGVTLPVIVDSTAIEFDVLKGSLAIEVAKFVAIGAVVAMLAAIGRLRGWPEVNGTMDGIVYGAAAGLGLATGDAFYREAYFSGFAVLIDVSPLTTLWTTLLSGLAEGLFGAIIGAGFGAASTARAAARRIGYPLAGLAVAFLAHAAYLQLARGADLGGSAGELRAWVALGLPVFFVVALAVRTLGQERGAIAQELADEAGSGAVTKDELHLLRNGVARRTEYAKRLLRGDFDGWIALRQLQNRQVQLALTERQARNENDPQRRAELSAQAERLREAARWSREVLQRASRSRHTGGQEARP